MSSTKSSHKRIDKVPSDSAVLSFDLYSNLTYMSALSTGEAPRDTIFQYAIVQPFMTAIYFRQVHLLTKKLGFEYARSFQLVSKLARAATVKSLLLRFAGSISSGESEHEFLAQEAAVEREQYIGQYERGLETLQKWGDAYAALMVSVSLIVVVAMISTMLYDIGHGFVFILNGTMFIMSLFGAYIIYKSAPYEVKTLQEPQRTQRTPEIDLLAIGVRVRWNAGIPIPGHDLRSGSGSSCVGNLPYPVGTLRLHRRLQSRKNRRGDAKVHQVSG